MNRRNLPFLLILLILLLPQGVIGAADQSILALFPDWTSEGGENGVEYGISVDSAGDINGDGYADAVIGAPKYLIDGQRMGAAFAFLGGPQGLSDTVHSRVSTLLSGSWFGASVSGAGDVNGDGYGDVIVGSPHFHQSSGYEGAAYVYNGSANGLINALPAWSKIGPMGDAQFGYAVSGVGDVNGDGYDDVLVGAIGYSGLESNEGAVFLFLGSPTGLGLTPAWQFESDRTTVQLGYAMSGGCDFNKDGYGDVIVSAPYYDQSGQYDTGKVWVFMGNSSGLNDTPAWTASGEAYSSFGSSVSCAGDVNGNGFADLLVGARGFDGDGFDKGAAYLFYNVAGILSTTPGWTAEGSQDYSGFGVSVAGMGDANMDGFADVAVGAHRQDGDQSKEGFVFVFRGGPTGLTPSAQVSGDKAETEFGFSVAGAGDVNADGKDDLLVGAPQYRRDEKTIMGRAYLYRGLMAGEVYVPEQDQKLYLPLAIFIQ